MNLAFNPLDIPNLGKSVANAILETSPTPIQAVSRFTGAGVYVMSYTGDFAAYEAISAANRDGQFDLPIYVGKATPSGGRRGVTLTTTGAPLFSRIDDHRKSIEEELFEELKALNRKPNELLFQSRTGTPIRSSPFARTVWKPLLDLAETMGLDVRPRFQDLRHTHVTWLLEDGVPIYVVSRRIGHASTAITEQVYGHINQSADVAALEVFSKRFKQAS